LDYDCHSFVYYLKINKMVETSKMEVDIEETTHESVAEQPKIKADAPTVLIAMGMAGSGKTTFVHVSYDDDS
jgi:ABC-type proline/glycine betaine transport system ATPase subunit